MLSNDETAPSRGPRKVEMMKRNVQRLVLALLVLALALLTTGCGSDDEHHEEEGVFGGSRILHDGETIEGDMPVMGGTLTMEDGSEVEGSLIVMGGTVTVAEGAEIEGDLAIMGGTVRLDGTVGGDVMNIGGTFYRGENAVVHGEVVPISGSEFPFEEGEGPIPPTAPEPPEAPFERSFRRSPADGFFGFVGNVVATLLRSIAFGALGLVLTLFMPDHVRRVAQAAEKAPVASAGVGCLTIPAVVVASVIAAITLIGIPVAILLPMLGFAASVFGWVGLGLFVGDRLLRSADIRSPRPAAAAAIGAGGLTLASSLIGVIPVLGWVVGPVLLLWGLGATVLTRGGTQSYPLRPRVAAPVSPMAFESVGSAPAAAPRARSGGRSDLFADLAADLGIEDEIYGDDDDLRPNRSEKPVPPPDKG